MNYLWYHTFIHFNKFFIIIFLTKLKFKSQILQRQPPKSSCRKFNVSMNFCHCSRTIFKHFLKHSMYREITFNENPVWELCIKFISGIGRNLNTRIEVNGKIVFYIGDIVEIFFDKFIFYHTIHTIAAIKLRNSILKRNEIFILDFVWFPKLYFFFISLLMLLKEPQRALLRISINCVFAGIICFIYFSLWNTKKVVKTTFCSFHFLNFSNVVQIFNFF